MPDIEVLRKLAFSFPETVEMPHFEKTSFRVAKKIFASFDEKTNIACIKLSPADQDLFTVFDRTIIYPVPNKWGQQGWTFVDLKRVPDEMFSDALKAAYIEVAPKKLGELIQP